MTKRLRTGVSSAPLIVPLVDETDVPLYAQGELIGMVLTDGTNPFTMTAGTINNWVRIGNRVFCNICLNWSSAGSASGAILVEDALPYACDAGGSASFRYNVALGTVTRVVIPEDNRMSARLVPSSTTIQLIKCDTSISSDFTGMLDTNFVAGSGATVNLSVDYTTDAAF
jgi:hypothetical protein